MANSHLLGSFVRRFLLESVIADRNLSRNTQKSYRDAIRLLLRFVAKRYGIDPTHLTVEDVNPEVVRNFLTYLEKEHSNSLATVNQSLTAIHSLFRFISQCLPELVNLATQVEAVPLRKTVLPTISYLEKKEMDAFLATPDRGRLQGQRDYALLLFLYNTGARASEAAQVTVGDLGLGTSPFVRILRKGRKVRLCPLWPHTPRPCAPCWDAVWKDHPRLWCSSMFAARPSPVLVSTLSWNGQRREPANKCPRFRKNA